MNPVCSHHFFSELCKHTHEDILHYLRHSGAYDPTPVSWKKKLSAFFIPSLLCVFLHRLSHWFWALKWKRTAKGVETMNLCLHKTRLSCESCIQGGLYIPHPGAVIFEGRAGKNLKLYAGSICLAATPSAGENRFAVLGDNVSLGAICFVQGPLAIGNDSQVGFQVCLTRSVPDHSIVMSPSHRIQGLKP